MLERLSRIPNEFELNILSKRHLDGKTPDAVQTYLQYAHLEIYPK